MRSDGPAHDSSARQPNSGSADDPLPAESGEAPMMSAHELSMTFGAVKAVQGASMDVWKGSCHALVGRNGAGKSTMVGMLSGLTKPDQGEVRFGGTAAPPVEDLKGWRRLVSCVYQKPNVVPHLSVAENLFLNRAPTRFGGRLDWGRVRREARALLGEWEIDVPDTLPAGELTVGQRQLVEIARALSQGVDVIILDEPTAQLESREIKQLFTRMRALQAAGATFLYISHHLQEIYEICDTVTVLRNGQKVVTAAVEDLPEAQLVTAMVGLEQPPARPRVLPAAEAGTNGRSPALEVRNATVDGVFTDINITVQEGELVGLAGLAGSGKATFGDAIAGVGALDSGEVLVRGTPIEVSSPRDAIRSGIGHVPEDRHEMGFIPLLSIAENLTFPIIRDMGRLGYVSSRRRTAVAREMMDAMEIVATTPGENVQSLSGGNQQKVVIGRAMVTDPPVLVLQHPTTGIDIAAKQTIARILGDAQADGKGVLIISDEYDELVNCTRIYVMFRGRIAREFQANHNEYDIVAAMENLDSAARTG